MANGQEQSSATQQLIWGTTINTTEFMTKFRNFIYTFTDVSDDSEDFTKDPYYIEQLKQLKESEQTVLELDCGHVYDFDQ